MITLTYLSCVEKQHRIVELSSHVKITQVITLRARTSLNIVSDCIVAKAALNSRIVPMLWMADSIRGLIYVWNVMDFPKSCFGETLLKGITAILENHHITILEKFKLFSYMELNRFINCWILNLKTIQMLAISCNFLWSFWSDYYSRIVNHHYCGWRCYSYHFSFSIQYSIN